MKLVINYEDERNDCNYYNNVISAIKVANEKFFIDKVEFINFPIGELNSLLALINQTTNVGKISLEKDVLLFVKTNEPLVFALPNNV